LQYHSHICFVINPMKASLPTNCLKIISPEKIYCTWEMFGFYFCYFNRLKIMYEIVNQECQFPIGVWLITPMIALLLIFIIMLMNQSVHQCFKVIIFQPCFKTLVTTYLNIINLLDILKVCLPRIRIYKILQSIFHFFVMFFFHNYLIFNQLVEVVGVEPTSKHAINKFSTSLFGFSKPTKYQLITPVRLQTVSNLSLLSSGFFAVCCFLRY